MQFIAALVLATFAAAMPAAQNGEIPPPDPSTYENLDVTDFTVTKAADGTVQAVTFTISGPVACSAEAPGTEGKVFGCGTTPYSFGLLNGTIPDSQFGLRLYKQTSPFAGFVGSGTIDVYCRGAGGLDSSVCDQVSLNTIVISAP